MTRILTALVLVPFFGYIIFWSPGPVFVAVVVAVAFLVFHEYTQLAAQQGMKSMGLFGYAAGLLILLVPSKDPTWYVLVAILGMALALRSEDLHAVLPQAAALVLGVAYVFGSLRCGVELRAISAYWLFFALSLNWAGDIAALYVGKMIGRHKLAPHISPAKSWEGSVGSLVVSLVYGALYLPRLLPSVPLAEGLGLTALANIAGQCGDLCESALKRGAGVKDSGTLLPGHGGWLDRLDSSLFALPVVYLVVANFRW